MLFGGHGYPTSLAIKPFLYLLPGFFERLRVLKNTGIGNEPYESQQTRPGKAQRLKATEPFVEPAAGGVMLLETSNMRVDEEVGIDEPHRKLSPSAMASASATSSMLPIRQRPKDTDLVS
jgi:hypothetical protein